jgi:hypothetical protein
MLNKVSNINTRNIIQTEKISPLKYIRENSFVPKADSDSASFSPAMELLKILDWDTYKMEYPAKNKLVLTFSIEGLEFHTSFNTDTLNTLSVLNYEIYNRAITGDCSVFFRNKFSSSDISDHPTKRKLVGLHQLFVRIAVYEKEISGDVLNEYSFIKNLLSDNAHNINSDFSFINNSLINFLNKLLKSNINKASLICPEEEDPFILLKVKFTKT